MHLVMHLLFLLFIPAFMCEDGDKERFSKDDFKCALPEVKSRSNNINLTQFKAEFSKISEVKFPGLIGPLREKLICKIKCIDGHWVGPLCSHTPNGRFQPVLRECTIMIPNPFLSVWFKNSSFEDIFSVVSRQGTTRPTKGLVVPSLRQVVPLSTPVINFAILVEKIKPNVQNETHFPHGSMIMARCTHFGHYKMKGESNTRCENGEWVPKLPECVPTTMFTNYSSDAPPTIKYMVISGSAVVEPNGELCVFPDSTVRLDCLTDRALGDPEWSWTQASGHHHAEWASDSTDQVSRYRLILSKMSARHSDQYTCTSPSGHTNTISIKVVSVVCPPINVSAPRVRVFAQGSRLGHAAHFSCQPGFQLEGNNILTCMATGLWSSHPPNCVETFCPAFSSMGAHLSLVEYNSSFGGRAVFQCAWGYRLVGAPGVECEMDGTWSDQPPHCAPIYCPDPLVPERGRLLTNASKDNKYPVGDLMIYSCEEGYEIVGESSIVCTENGFWSHPPPFCMPPSERRKSDTIYIENTTLVHVEE